MKNSDPYGDSPGKLTIFFTALLLALVVYYVIFAMSLICKDFDSWNQIKLAALPFHMWLSPVYDYIGNWFTWITKLPAYYTPTGL